jgi:ADP-ribosylglycohydrolase
MIREDMQRQIDEYYVEPLSPASRRLACLLGGAIGDALGYRVEFRRWPDIEHEYGAAGIQLEKASGTLIVSDDTQMTLFTLEGMTRAASGNRVIDEVREAYLDWLGTQSRRGGRRESGGHLASYSVLRQAQAPGNTCLSALEQGGKGTVVQPINNSKGCGGVMRTAPLGFLPETVTDTEVFRFGVEAAALTHGHPDGYLPAGAMAVLVRDALSDVPWDASVTKVLRLVRAWSAGEGTAAALEATLKASAMPASRARIGVLGEGWVGEEAIAIGLYAARVSRSFAECIELAANHDGDSDSTASIAGQLWGARHGLAELPKDATSRLDALGPLLEVSGKWERVMNSRRETA